MWLSFAKTTREQKEAGDFLIERRVQTTESALTLFGTSNIVSNRIASQFYGWSFLAHFLQETS